MRKIKKNKKNGFIIIGIIYLIILLTISTAYSFFNENLTIKATTSITNSENYKVSAELTAKWGSDNTYYYHYTPTLVYLGNETIKSWKLFIKVPYDTEITSCYNATCTVEGEILTITNGENNGTLTPQSNSITIGYQMTTSNGSYEFETVGASFSTSPSTEGGNTGGGESGGNTGGEESGGEETPDNNPIDVDYINPNLNITGGWGTTSTYIFTVKNSSPTETIESWSLDITFPIGTKLSSCWGGTYTYNTDTGILTIKGPDWAPTLPPDASAEVNFFMDTGQAPPYTPIVGQFTAKTVNGIKIQANTTIGGT